MMLSMVTQNNSGKRMHTVIQNLFCPILFTANIKTFTELLANSGHAANKTCLESFCHVKGLYNMVKLCNFTTSKAARISLYWVLIVHSSCWFDCFLPSYTPVVHWMIVAFTCEKEHMVTCSGIWSGGYTFNLCPHCFFKSGSFSKDLFEQRRFINSGM